MCPKCGSHDLRRSSTRWFERPLRWILGGAMYRCRACQWRGWQQSPSSKHPHPKVRTAKIAHVDQATALGALIVLLIVGVVVGLFVMVSSSTSVSTGGGTPQPRWFSSAP